LLDHGALAFILKEADPSQLIEAIETVMQNRIYKNKILTEALYWKRNKLINKSRKKIHEITETDRKVLSLLWQEKSTREIANEILLSISTIEKIKQNLKEKLDVKTTIGLIKYAVENKIILVNQSATQ
jgi:DNA-binding NarL/FixJ family response regulator